MRLPWLCEAQATLAGHSTMLLPPDELERRQQRVEEPLLADMGWSVRARGIGEGWPLR